MYKPDENDLLSGTDVFLFTPITFSPKDGLLYPMGLTCITVGLPMLTSIFSLKNKVKI